MKTWNHVALVREGPRVAVYLNGGAEPDIAGEVALEGSPEVFLGGCWEKAATFEGRMDEVAIYGRALSVGEIVRHCQLARGGGVLAAVRAAE